MIAVVFEAWPKDARAREEYLRLAAELGPRVAEIDGFVSIERFQSLTEPDKIVSISFWRDEEAIARWRSFEEHRAAQRAGREAIFRAYRLRVGHIVRDYGMPR